MGGVRIVKDNLLLSSIESQEYHHPHQLNLILSNIPYQGGAIIGVFMI
jgi:hypothetical protein